MTSSEKESAVSLRISSRILAISEISQILDELPSRAHEKGERISLKSPESKVREETLWFIDTDLVSSMPLEEHLQKIIEFIELHITSLQKLRSKGCDIDVYCCFTTFTDQGGFVLTNDILQRLTILPIDLVVDIYSMKGP